MHIQLDATKIYSLAELWMLAPEIVIEELTAATAASQALLERETKERTPIGAHGLLRSSIQSTTPVVMSGTVLGVVGSPMSYAESVELGTKPHPVNQAGVDAIEDWVRYKLGISAEDAQRVAASVVWKIRMRGTPKVEMFSKTLEAQRQEVAGHFKDATTNITRRLSGVAR